MRPEVHVFVVWPAALSQLDRILADVDERFRVIEVVRLGWSARAFDRNVLRFYGKPVLADDEKRAAAGSPFVVVVEDEAPVYELRPRSFGRASVNARMFDAKKRYRSWAGGMHAVHASIEVAEADRDLFYLLGARAEEYRDREVWNGTIAQVEGELIGAEGWDDVDQLFTAVALAMPLVVLEQYDELHILVESVRWAVLFADARSAVRRRDGVACEVLVAGALRTLVLQEPNDGVLDTAWQRRLLPAAAGVPERGLAAGPADRLLARSHRLAAYAPQLLPDTGAELARLAADAGLQPLEWADARAARAAVEAQLQREGLAFVDCGSSADFDLAFLHGRVPEPVSARSRRDASARERLRSLTRRR